MTAKERAAKAIAARKMLLSNNGERLPDVRGNDGRKGHARMRVHIYSQELTKEVVLVSKQQIDLALEKAQSILTLDDMISILELKLMVLRDEQAEAVLAEKDTGE